MHSISLVSDVNFGENIVSVHGSYDNFLSVCYHPFPPSFVTMSSSKPIGARRMSEWYKELTDKDYDPHSPFSIHVSDAIVGTNRSSYQIQEPVENDEERLSIENDFTSSASTSSPVSTSSSCYDENERNMWNPCWSSSVTCRLACAWRR